MDASNPDVWCAHGWSQTCTEAEVRRVKSHYCVWVKGGGVWGCVTTGCVCVCVRARSVNKDTHSPDLPCLLNQSRKQSQQEGVQGEVCHFTPSWSQMELIVGYNWPLNTLDGVCQSQGKMGTSAGMSRHENASTLNSIYCKVSICELLVSRLDKKKHSTGLKKGQNIC